MGEPTRVWSEPTEASGVLRVETPLSPPGWALLERELLRAHAEACDEFFARYFDERGFLLCVERWGGDDGPDDAAEAVTDWPLLHALGGADSVREQYRLAWEGHLRQYTLARTTEVPLARDGMYYKEFPTHFDWLHNGEGVVAFNLHGLSDPGDPAVLRRARRYAGFYMNEDPGAPNYDPERRIIRSMFNGSRGPLLRKATALDWAGDPIEVANRFSPQHREQSYEEMLLHFRDYTDVVGDHPLNLMATNLVVNAHLLTGEGKYRDWVLEYVDAWRERMAANGGVIPTNVGLDGVIGSAADGKWYGGVYGWGFSVYDPGSQRIVHRNQAYQGYTGFANAFLLTGDAAYLDAWSGQSDRISEAARQEDGQTLYPRMHGDEGWYDFHPSPYSHGALQSYLFTMRASDRVRCPASPWLEYLEGKHPGYPEAALGADLSRVRQQVQAMREDASTPDTRMSDDPMLYNPCSVGSLIRLATGAGELPRAGNLLFCRLRHFDPERRRTGLPQDVAALIETMDAESVTVQLVNTNQVAARTVILQGGAHGEHRLTGVEVDGVRRPLTGTALTVRLGPGCGARLALSMQLHAARPTLAFPWSAG